MVARVPPRQVRGEARYSPASGSPQGWFFAMDCQSIPDEEDDPHYRELGCYLVPVVNLVSRHKAAVLRLVS
jgi:hypothetical protein